jgi:hypothetical protein
MTYLQLWSIEAATGHRPWFIEVAVVLLVLALNTIHTTQKHPEILQRRKDRQIFTFFYKSNLDKWLPDLSKIHFHDDNSKNSILLRMPNHLFKLQVFQSEQYPQRQVECRTIVTKKNLELQRYACLLWRNGDAESAHHLLLYYPSPFSAGTHYISKCCWITQIEILESLK